MRASRTNILITGSSGQVGTNLTLHLQSLGHRVFGVDKRPNRWTNQIDAAVADLTTVPDLESVLSGQQFDVVVHLAAHAKVHQLVAHPEQALENFIMATRVAEFCRLRQLPLVFASSREVYGNRPTRGAIREGQVDPRRVASPYAATKLAAEALIRSYASCYDLRYLIFRLSNVYGRFDNDLERMERVIPLFIRKISRGEPIVIYGRKKVLDFTYVDDCVSGLTAGIGALTSGEVVNATMNLAYGQGHSLAGLAEYIGEAVGRPVDMSFLDSHKGEVTYYVADIGEAQRQLGYSPRTPLREGVRKAVEWNLALDARSVAETP